MSGILIEVPGDSSNLQWRTDIPVPTLKENEILVRNEFTGVNYIDTHFRAGRYKAAYPLILGVEAAGTVVAVHPSVAADFKQGDRVAHMATESYAQYTAVAALRAVHLPVGISTPVGAAILAQGLTALTLIREAHEVRPGQWVLIHGAAGGTGLLLCQMCKAVGARVIGTVSTAAKGEAARRNGAEFVVNTIEEDWIARVKEITGDYGVDAVFDAVGKVTFEGDLEVAARKGTIVCFGNTSGAVPPVDLLKLAGTKNLKLCKPTVYAYLTTKEEMAKYCADLFEMVQTGKVKVDIHETYDLEDAAKAHDELEGRRSTGKLLLRVL